MAKMRRAEKIRTVDLTGGEVRAWNSLGDDGITVILKGVRGRFGGRGGFREKGKTHLDWKRRKTEKRVKEKEKKLRVFCFSFSFL